MKRIALATLIALLSVTTNAVQLRQIISGEPAAAAAPVIQTATTGIALSTNANDKDVLEAGRAIDTAIVEAKVEAAPATEKAAAATTSASADQTADVNGAHATAQTPAEVAAPALPAAVLPAAQPEPVAAATTSVSDDEESDED